MSHRVEPDSAAPYTADMSRSRSIRFGLGLILLALLSACSGGMSFPLLANPDPAANPPSIRGGTDLPADGVIFVRPGDTIYALARRYGVSQRTIIETNRLEPPYLLHVGDRLVLPTPSVYVVRYGDTLSEIAQARGVDFRQLATVNGLRPPYAIRVGQRLSLPGATDGSDGGVVAARTPQSPTIAQAPAPEPRDPNQPWSSDGQLNFPVGGSRSARTVAPPIPAPRPVAGVAANDTAPAVTIARQPAPPTAAPSPAPSGGTLAATSPVAVLTPPPRGGRRFLWPVEGKVIAGFGAREGGLHNDGINIAAPEGTRIRAAENGVVVYAGNELRGFGNLLLIKHADGWTTAYAHADTLLVRRGDRVARGQPIATVGETGNVDRPQLHFEIRKGPRPVDPRDELGAQT